MDRHPVELRAFDASTGEFEAVAVVYGVTDTYRTRFLPGCFADSLRRGLPPVSVGPRSEPEGDRR
jgi:hypothetical protein